MNQLMDFESQGSQIMHFMESQDVRPADLFKEILDCNYQQQNGDQLIDFFNPKKMEFGQFYDDLEDLQAVEKKCQEHLSNSTQKPSTLQKLQTNMIKQVRDGVINQIQTEGQLKSKRLLREQKGQRYRRSTKCDSRVEQCEVQIEHVEKSPQLTIDFTFSQNQECSQETRKVKKLRKKIDKFLLKEKHFGTTLKISFPKKIVQMFINHYHEFQIQNEQVRNYNDNLKMKLKQTKKNDYTFEKEVSQILGEMKQPQDQIIDETSSKTISFTNRSIFSEIIKRSMKEEVIMRDKIAKNRQLYMIQLKVYALRCRSHKLAKKGTYK